MRLFLSKQDRDALNAAVSMQERVERLEIALRSLKLNQDALASGLEDLSERLHARVNSLGGRLGGRPRKERPGAPEGGLEAIPHGDKAALRRHFQTNPPKREEEQ